MEESTLYQCYQNKKLDQLDAETIARETAEYGIVVIENSGATPEEYAEWAKGCGHHISPGIWCTDDEHSDLFWRVTNEKIDGKNQGLFADYELDWHTNVTPVADAEECVGLYAKTITYHTETWFCNSIPYWHTLDASTREYYKQLQVVLDPHRRLGLIKSSWQPNFRELYEPHVLEGIVKNRDSRNYIHARGIFEDHNFVPNHPMGTEGFFFTPYEVHGWKQNDKLIDNSEELWNTLWNEWIASDKYTYKHVWKPGDIVLMDQLITIHRRPDILKDQPRDLLRTASWYNKDIRVHQEPSL